MEDDNLAREREQETMRRAMVSRQEDHAPPLNEVRFLLDAVSGT